MPRGPAHLVKHSDSTCTVRGLVPSAPLLACAFSPPPGTAGPWARALCTVSEWVGVAREVASEPPPTSTPAWSFPSPTIPALTPGPPAPAPAPMGEVWGTGEAATTSGLPPEGSRLHWVCREQLYRPLPGIFLPPGPPWPPGVASRGGLSRRAAQWSHARRLADTRPCGGGGGPRGPLSHGPRKALRPHPAPPLTSSQGHPKLSVPRCPPQQNGVIGDAPRRVGATGTEQGEWCRPGTERAAKGLVVLGSRASLRGTRGPAPLCPGCH